MVIANIQRIRVPLGRQERPFWHVLRHREFRLYFAGGLASNLGTWIQNTAQVILVYQLTRSVFAVGLVTCVQFSGSLVLSPYAAVLASRLGTKRILVGSQIFSAVMAAAQAALEFSGRLTETWLIVGALTIGLAFTFTMPVQTAAVPTLVPEGDIEAAMAMNSVCYNAGRALAPVLCVGLIETMGFGWAFALNAISFGIFAVALIKVRLRTVQEPPEPTRARDGISAALDRSRILLLLVMVAAVTFAEDPVLVLGPTLARHLGTTDLWPGYFLSALGCGTVLGSFRRTGGASGNSAMSKRAAQSLLVLGSMITLFAVGVSPWISLVAALVAGVAALQVSSATQSMLVQQDRRRVASVMALWAIAWAGSKPLASLADGWLASRVSLWFAGAALAAPAIILAVLEIYLPKPCKRWLKEWISELINALRPGRRPGSSSNVPGKGYEMGRSDSPLLDIADGPGTEPAPSLMDGADGTHEAGVASRSLSMHGSGVALSDYR
jgi:predicted MFS family arabinose efflux permease